MLKTELRLGTNVQGSEAVKQYRPFSELRDTLAHSWEFQKKIEVCIFQKKTINKKRTFSHRDPATNLFKKIT